MSSSEVSSGEDSEPPSSRNSQKGSEHRTSGGFCRNPKRWNFGNLIGEGAYGKVKEIIDTRSKKLYAVKILTQKKLRNIPGGSDSILREIRIMQKIDHKNCIQFVDYWTDEKKKSFLVLEYVGGGSLQEYLDQSSSNLLSLYQARKLFKQLMKALKHIHGLGIVHRDVKPDNIMLDSKKSKLKLSDFGIAYCPAEKGNNTPSDEEADNPRKRCYGSPAYQSPEVTSGKGPAFHPAVDVWAAGIILYQMCFGKYPFQIASSDVLKNSNKGLKETLNGLCQCKMNIPEGTDPQLCNLLKGMLEVDPQKRLTVSQVRSSSWMKMKIKKTKPSEMVPIRSSCSREVRSSFLGTSTKFVKCNFVASKRE